MSSRSPVSSLPSFLAMSCVGFIASSMPAMAEDAAPAEGKRLGGVTVTDTAIEDDIKVDRVESPKATAPLTASSPPTATAVPPVASIQAKVSLAHVYPNSSGPPAAIVAVSGRLTGTTCITNTNATRLRIHRLQWSLVL